MRFKISLMWMAVLFVIALVNVNGHAQDSPEKFELGVHYTSLWVMEKSDKDSGVGLRFSYNLNKYLAIEGEANALPQTREGGGNNETQAFFGSRVGIRRSRYGLFVKARPGFSRFYLLGTTPGPNTFEQGHTRFAMDVGGVVEYHPGRHTGLRLDVGDTIVKYKPGDFFYQRLDEPMFVTKQLSHNLQVTIGFAFRF